MASRKTTAKTDTEATDTEATNDIKAVNAVRPPPASMLAGSTFATRKAARANTRG